MILHDTGSRRIYPIRRNTMGEEIQNALKEKEAKRNYYKNLYKNLFLLSLSVSFFLLVYYNNPIKTKESLVTKHNLLEKIRVGFHQLSPKKKVFVYLVVAIVSAVLIFKGFPIVGSVSNPEPVEIYEVETEIADAIPYTSQSKFRELYDSIKKDFTESESLILATTGLAMAFYVFIEFYEAAGQADLYHLIMLFLRYAPLIFVPIHYRVLVKEFIRLGENPS